MNDIAKVRNSDVDNGAAGKHQRRIGHRFARISDY
jgi:hypothetical protein